MENIDEPTEIPLPLSKVVQIDQICDQFDRAIHEAIQNQKPWPNIEEYLADTAEPVRSELWKELLAVEASYGQQQAEGGDPAGSANSAEILRRQVRESGGGPALGAFTAEQTAAFIPSEQPGTIVAGRYKLLEAIGEGGMGTVWVAEQTQPVRRKVALKLIKAGMDSKSVLARFEAERQALAVMDHPNIAKVLDGGLTETGRPFFVMEHVKGVPITEYCEATRMNVPERLQLFGQVCQAVQHAHQKGIIHRDLKPSNILIAPYDDKPVPKVIDFGLAKREGIPQEQWCYEPNDQGKYAEGMTPATDYLQRRGYRLPTEAEWEYACRSGSDTSRYYGTSVTLLPKYAWFEDNSDDRLWPVGMKKPNDYGLFDMLGELLEWCDNIYLEDYGYSDDSGTGTDLENMVYRVLRGGVFSSPASDLRSAWRGFSVPTSRTNNIGFRVARTLETREVRAMANRVIAVEGKFLARGQRSSWSPDGKKIVFGRSGNDNGILIYDIATNKKNPFITAGKDPVWAGKDGRWIAYVSGASGSGATEAVFAAEVPDGKPFRVAAGCMPSWSADGATLFFQAFDQNQVMATEVTGNEQFSPPRVRSAMPYRYPAVSPDGKCVAYKSGGDLVIQQLDDKKVAKRFVLPKGDGMLGAWSPDNREFGFGGWNPGDPMPCIILDVETGLARQVASRRLTMPAWSPDGSKITFDLRLSSGTEIWMIDADAIKKLPSFKMEAR